MQPKFDPDPLLSAKLKAIQDTRRANRKSTYRRSRLDPLRADIQHLATLGASMADIVEFLKTEHRIRVDATTVSRRLKVWASESHADFLDVD